MCDSIAVVREGLLAETALKSLILPVNIHVVA
jgi:hypothetical protein